MSEESKSVDPALTTQVQTIRAIAATHNLLVECQFPVSKFKLASECTQFLANMHKAALTASMDHPDADSIPELKAHREALKEDEVPNGETQEN